MDREGLIAEVATASSAALINQNTTALTEFDDYFPAVFPAFPPEAEELTALFSQYAPHFLTTFLIDESAASHDLSAMQWSTAETYAKLIANYQQEHYAEYPDKTPEAKPLESLWAQWYFGLSGYSA